VKTIIFDMDGVIVDSDEAWASTRRAVAERHGGRWHDGAERAMQGVSTAEWIDYMVGDLGVDLAPDDLREHVVAELQRRYRDHPPLLPGAVETVRSLAQAGRRLGLASGSPQTLIDAVLAAGAIADAFAVTLSADEVERGKPSPDVYLEAAARLGVEPATCLAVEDSTNGIRAAVAAGMEVYAVPNRHAPPDAEALALPSRCAQTLPELFRHTGSA
jgi:HAD superfamily hydrolase (TIGR01509 family)